MRIGPGVDLSRAFKWLTRVGIGVRAGSRPIGWYQQHQVCALDALEAAASSKLGTRDVDVRVSRGVVRARAGRRSVAIGTVREFASRADSCARR
jgi:hypothetical protein